MGEEGQARNDDWEIAIFGKWETKESTKQNLNSILWTLKTSAKKEWNKKEKIESWIDRYIQLVTEKNPDSTRLGKIKFICIMKKYFQRIFFDW